jgi:hypothetical protein
MPARAKVSSRARSMFSRHDDTGTTITAAEHTPPVIVKSLGGLGAVPGFARTA